MGRILWYERMGDVSAAVNYTARECDWDETVLADVFYDRSDLCVAIFAWFSNMQR